MLRTFVEHLLNEGLAPLWTVSRVFYTHVDDLLINHERVF